MADGVVIAMLVTKLNERLDAEKALADDLYATLDRLIPDDGVLGPSVAAVKARYRQARK